MFPCRLQTCILVHDQSSILIGGVQVVVTVTVELQENGTAALLLELDRLELLELDRLELLEDDRLELTLLLDDEEDELEDEDRDEDVAVTEK